MKVVAYLNGIPFGNKNLDKPKMLTDFIAGVNKVGDTGIVVSAGGPVDCDVAVLQGFVHENSRNTPHLKLRREVIEFQKAKNKRTIIIDSNLFLYRAAPTNYLRFSYDGVFPNTGEYCNAESSNTNWNNIKKELNFDLQPWKKTGDYILLCLQRGGGWSMGKVDVESWAKQTIKQIKTLTSTPIVVRGHPGDRFSGNVVESLKKLGITPSTNGSLLLDLASAKACVTFNSSPGVASAIEGVPTFVLDPSRSQATPVSHTSLEFLENPKEFDRTQWIQNIAQCHWNFDDMSSGRTWQYMKQWAVK